MDVEIKIDEWGVFRPESHGGLHTLPTKLSELLTLAVESMESLDRRLYWPDMRRWHKGAKGDGVCRVNYAGAIMAHELGLPRDMDADDWSFDTEGYYVMGFNAVEAVAHNFNLRDGILYAACREEFFLPEIGMDEIYARFDAEIHPEQAAMIANYKQYGAMNRPYFGWADIDRRNIALGQIAAWLRRNWW